MDPFLSTDEVAKSLGVSRPTVIKYIQEDRLSATRTGKAYKIPRDKFVDFAKGLGMTEDHLLELGILLSQKKKTGALQPDASPTLAHHQPPYRLVGDPDETALYFLAVRMDGAKHDMVVRVDSGNFFIGRHSLASISIQDPYISNIHAKLVYQDGYVRVLDQSTNGTQTASGELHAGDHVLMGDGDQFMVGHTVLTLIAPARVDQYFTAGINASQFHDRT